MWRSEGDFAILNTIITGKRYSLSEVLKELAEVSQRDFCKNNVQDKGASGALTLKWECMDTSQVQQDQRARCEWGWWVRLQ